VGAGGGAFHKITFDRGFFFWLPRFMGSIIDLDVGLALTRLVRWAGNMVH